MPQLLYNILYVLKSFLKSWDVDSLHFLIALVHLPRLLVHLTQLYTSVFELIFFNHDNIFSICDLILELSDLSYLHLPIVRGFICVSQIVIEDLDIPVFLLYDTMELLYLLTESRLAGVVVLKLLLFLSGVSVSLLGELLHIQEATDQGGFTVDHVRASFWALGEKTNIFVFDGLERKFGRSEVLLGFHGTYLLVKLNDLFGLILIT